MQQFPDQTWYDGEFEFGQMAGVGKLFFANGALKYKGGFVDGLY
jgi:hypothetical protein